MLFVFERVLVVFIHANQHECMATLFEVNRLKFLVDADNRGNGFGVVNAHAVFGLVIVQTLRLNNHKFVWIVDFFLADNIHEKRLNALVERVVLVEIFFLVRIRPFDVVVLLVAYRFGFVQSPPPIAVGNALVKVHLVFPFLLVLVGCFAF